MAAKSKRRSVMESLLGDKKKADDLSQAMDTFEQLALKLDAAGINRKEYIVARAKAFAEDLHAQIVEALTALTDDEALRNDLANKFIAMAMGAFAAEDVTDVVETPADEAVEEIMAEDEPMPMEDEEEDEEEVVMAEMRQQIVALARESAQVHKAWVSDVIPAIIEIAKTQKALIPLVKKAEQIDSLDAQIKALQGVVNMAPRVAASQSEKTVVIKDGKMQQVETEIKKGTEGTKLVLGVPVKN